MRRLISIFLLATVASTISFAQNYTIDLAHSNVVFKVRHMMISTVYGSFTDFKGALTFDSNKLDTLTIEAEVKASSINTNNDKRDEHLRSKDFFDVGQYPTLSFQSTKAKFKKNKGQVWGNLTMHGITKPIVLDATFSGLANMGDSKKAAFSATTRLDRRDFGLNWNKVIEAGGVAVGHDVDIVLEIQANEVVVKTDSVSEK